MVLVDRFMKILVVDDYKSMVEMIQDLLSDLGFDNTDDAANGQQALDKLRAESYGLVICDWKMAPMDGYELLRQVRADPDLEKLPFMMVTAEPRVERVLKAREAGVNGFLAKPFTRASLKQQMSAVIGPFAA
jgi:two-component system chemotaxis response regulator CheY